MKGSNPEVGSSGRRLDQIVKLCAHFPADRKLIFVPSRQLGVNLQTAIAREGTAWANLETTTVLEHAEMEIGPRFRADGWSRITSDSASLLLLDIVRDAQTSFFRDAGLSPTLIRGLMHTLTTLRMEDVAAARLGASLFKQDDRSRALEEVFRGFDDRLAANRLYDGALLLRRAFRELEPDTTTRIAAILDETQVSQLECRYLKEKWRDRLVRIDGLAPEADPPDDCAAKRLSGIPTLKSTIQSELATDGQYEPHGKGPGPNKIRTQTVLGSENEIRCALRRVTTKGLPLDTIEIAYTAQGPYLSMIIGICDRYGIDASFAEGIPALLTGPGQALQCYLQWLRSGYETDVLTEHMRAGNVTLRNLAGSTGLDDQTFATLLDEARIGKGADRYLSSLSRLFKQKERVTERWLHTGRDVEEQASLEATRALQKGIGGLLRLIPLGERCLPGDLIAMALEFLSRCGTVRSELDKKSLESIRDRLMEIRDPTNRKVSVAWIVRLLLDMIERHTVEASSEKGGRLYVVPLARAGYSSRRRLFVVGLDQDSFRSSDTEDPFLLDVERTAISKHLVPMYRRTGDAVFQLKRAIGMSDCVYLTASVHDVSTGDTLHVAPVFQEYQQAGEDDEPELLSLVAAGHDADASLDATEHLLRYRNHAGYLEFMSDRWPELDHGRAAERERAAVGVSHFDGWVTKLPSELATYGTSAVFSASRIERLAACPYRYFLHDILKARAPIREDRDPTRWLSALEFGKLLHEVYHDFLAELKRLGEKVDSDRHEEMLTAILERRLHRYRDEVPVFNEAAKRADMRRLQRSLKVFLNAESRSEAADPVGFEISFGQGRADDLNRPDPIRLELGNGPSFLLNGKIDRVDRVEEGLVVVDYKTGSQYRYETGDLLNGGLNLQWALYALALDTLIESWNQTGPVVRSGYYFASHQGNGRRIEERPPTADVLGKTIGPLFEMARHGYFPHAHKEGGQCTFCDFRTVCQNEALAGRRLFNLIGTLEDDPRPFVLPLKNWIRGR